jgi:hypothetical protein
MRDESVHNSLQSPGRPRVRVRGVRVRFLFGSDDILAEISGPVGRD